MKKHIEKDDRVWKKLQKELMKLSHLSTNVGFVDPRDSYPSGINVAQNAQWQNEGTRFIPSRPFLTRVHRKASAGVLDYLFIKAAIAVGTSLDSPRAAVDELGNELSDLIKEEIDSGNFEELRDWTIARKGNDIPLIETTRMINSVGHEVVNA